MLTSPCSVGHVPPILAGMGGAARGDGSPCGCHAATPHTRTLLKSGKNLRDTRDRDGVFKQTQRVTRVRVTGLLLEVGEIDSILDQSQMDSEIVAIADYLGNTTGGCGDTDLNMDEAIEQIRQQAGTHFHTAVVKALMKVALEKESVHLCVSLTRPTE